MGSSIWDACSTTTNLACHISLSLNTPVGKWILHVVTKFKRTKKLKEFAH